MTNAAHFANMPDGTPVAQITLRGGGLTARVLTHGARIQDLRLDGVAHPLVLGSSDFAPYLDDMLYFGAIVGRFANRIAGGAFVIDGTPHQVDRNFLGKHCLHGGSDGTASRVWEVAALKEDEVQLRLDLADGEMGFPGAMQVMATIALPGDGVLAMDIRAKSDAATPCSFAHHGYFNLDGSADIADHLLQVAAETYLPVDAEMIPLGAPDALAGTAFDFRAARALGHSQVDHNFCLATARRTCQPVANLTGATSGVKMRVETTEPGLQVYGAATFPAAGLSGFDGRRYGPHAGLALETQSWPDAPNRPTYPDTILRPGERYHHQVRYVFDRSETASA